MTFPINSFFSCDALSLLERLPSETITLAYLEPPWNTGSTFERDTTTFGFSSDDELGNYLSKVLQQLRRILTAQGSVFLHWSPQATPDMRLVGSQAFGCPPRYEITRVRRSIGRFPKDTPRLDHEFLLVYSKSDDFIYNTQYRALTLEEKKARYTFKDDRGTYATSIMTIGICRPTFQFDWRGYKPEPTRSWAFPEQKLEDLARDGRIHFPSSGSLPRLKRYLADHPGM